MSVKESEILWLKQFIQAEVTANSINDFTDLPLPNDPTLPDLPRPNIEDFPSAEEPEELKAEEFIVREII
jgi:hypothetical protein